MAARKLQQEVDKCFKKVQEGVAEFDSIYEKIEQSTNPAQKDKLEDNLKREIKKLQRLRDQIKTWAAGNEIKDKAPLMEQRRLIETQMERFKAVEKAMKTKAYSKEGLSAGQKLDPKEQVKVEAIDFLASQVDELEQQIETMEAEGEALQVSMKKGKGQSAKAKELAEIERRIERHKWHQGKLELIRRSLENGGVEPEQITEIEDSIRYYVAENMNDDFMEDEELYDELNLDEEQDAYGMNQDNDKGSSQDTQSVQDEPEPEVRPTSISSGKGRTEAVISAGRRPSAQLKSPLPTLATLHTPMSTISNGNSATAAMKPAAVPTRPVGEGLKYASAAAAAAVNVGIAPLPPPPGAPAAAIPSGSAPSTTAQGKQPSAHNSPSPLPSQPAGPLAVPAVEKAVAPAPAPAPSPKKSENTKSSRAASKAQAAASQVPETSKGGQSAAASKAKAGKKPTQADAAPQTNGQTNGFKPAPAIKEEQEEESIYHLPASLHDLVDSFQNTKKRPAAANSSFTLRMLAHAQAMAPEALETDGPRNYQPDTPVTTNAQFPREPLEILDDPRLYSRIDPDTLFYVFYYKQGTLQQYLAAKALKEMSWRFHKQYQTWFQRHEEPKNITEEYEQGTYRFFDYESTWMNRRKADFKFAYKFLEDEVV